MVSAGVQQAIAQRYAQLADSITHGKQAVEKSIVAPQLIDRGKIKLGAYEYDPLTVLVQRVNRHGAGIVVKASYVGVRGRNEVTFDRWLLVDGTWRLMERDPAGR